MGNRPIACHAVESLVTAGIDDIAVVAPAPELDQVRQCIRDDGLAGARISYLPQEQPDLLGAMATAEEFVDERPAIVHLGDGLLGQQLDSLVHERDRDELPDLLLLLYRGEAGRRGLPSATQRLLGVSELDGPGDRLAVAGVCAFGPGAVSRAVRSPHELQRIDMVSIAEGLAAQGSRLEAGVVRGWRRYEGDPADLLELNMIVLDQQVVHHEFIDRGDNRIEGRVVIHPSADVTSSVILGPSIIGPNARIANSYIGPYTSVGAGAEIEGAEVVRSIVAEGARIMHIRGRIEGSTIGQGANIVRDFRLPRAMRFHVGNNVQIALD